MIKDILTTTRKARRVKQGIKNRGSKWIVMIINLYYQLKEFRIIMETRLWVCLGGCFQRGITEEGRPILEDEQAHPQNWRLKPNKKKNMN